MADAQLPVSAICQAALEQAVRDVAAMRASDTVPSTESSLGPFERFTPRAQHAITLAEKVAFDLHHNRVDTEHLLLGVLDEGGNLALQILATLGIEATRLRMELLESMPTSKKPGKARLQMTPLTKKALELTALEALQLGHNHIGCEHLLLGLLATEEGLASQVLRRVGVELRITRQALLTALASRANPPATTVSTMTPSVTQEIIRRLDMIERRLAQSDHGTC